MEYKGITRRRFLQLWRRSVSARPLGTPDLSSPPKALTTRVSHLRTPLRPLTPLTKANSLTEETFVLRPPGALPEELFQTTCERCGNCAAACPVQAILPLATEPGIGTPHIDPSISPCALCTGLKCTQVCPSGALRPLSAPSEVRMGTALIETTRCTAWRGLPCRICYEVCPVPGVIILERGDRAFVPVAGGMPCVGCGVCQHHCPAEGAIRIVPLIDDDQGRVRLVTNHNTGDRDVE